MATGDMLKNKRLEAGLSRKELGDKVNVTESMIGQLERGTKTLTLPLAKEIAKVLGCSISDF